MSNPDPPSRPGSKLSDFRRSPSGPKVRVPGPEPDAGDDAPPQRSRFLVGCASILMVLVGILLLLPGACFVALRGLGGGMVETGIFIIMVGLAAIVGGIALLTRGRSTRTR
jgi:hypothetical protein